jgi:hypothetical protein
MPWKWMPWIEMPWNDALDNSWAASVVNRRVLLSSQPFKSVPILKVDGAYVVFSPAPLDAGRPATGEQHR